MAPFKFFTMEVHFNPDSMANILVIKDVASIPVLHISMYLRKERAIIAEYKNQIIKFQECHDGLYYYDNANKFISHIDSYSFLITVKDNKEYFRISEIQGAEEARKVQQEIGWPSTYHFKDIVSKQLLRNCKFTVDDISIDELIYGSPAPILQGKTTRVKPKFAKIEIIPPPLPIYQHHEYLHLYIDVFCKWSTFLSTKTNKVNLITSKPCI